MHFELEDGFVFLIDKDLHWTSFDVVKKIRNTIKQKKVGHAGTLDPLASGLMIICTGKGTKKIESLMGVEKEYTGTFRLGGTTPSYDLETAIDAVYPVAHITADLILETAKAFVGPQMQIPPIYSALKVEGKKLYELARSGKEVKIEPRPVEIKEFEITEINLPKIAFRVVVSKGTYIRSLAFDFGKACGSGGHLAELRRTRVGNYTIQNALTVTEWMQWWKLRTPTEDETPTNTSN